MDNNFSSLTIPDFVLTSWFSHHLVAIENPLDTFKEQKISTSIPYLGANKKNILIVVSEVDGVVISENNLTLLEKLLTACKLNIADVVIVNIAKNPTSYKYLTENFKPEKLMLMGVEPEQIDLPLVFPMHKIQKYNNCQMLITTGITRMHNSADASVLQEKKELWALLKQLFLL